MKFGRSLFWIVLLGFWGSLRAAELPHIDLQVNLDPPEGMMHVSGRLSLPAGLLRQVRLNGASEVRAFSVNGRALVVSRSKVGSASMLRWQIEPSDRSEAKIEFEYSLRLEPLDATLDHRAVLGLDVPVSGAQGAFIPAGSMWHPVPEGVAMTHRVEMVVPKGMKAIVPGRLVEEGETAAGYAVVFESRRALPGIDLIAGPYAVSERKVSLGQGRSVRVRTYFHDELRDIADAYLTSAADYLVRYDRAIGPYAHPGYSIVSSPLPTGFGMPGIAYLGRRVLRLPFIRATSLGHEVLHDWWGNGVYPDYQQGNWSEGLTTFMADYAYKEDEGAAAAKLMREAWLRDYAAVPTGQDQALKSFVSRRHGADQAVGYNKSAFVFYMLRERLGAQAFAAGLRRFWHERAGTVASWAHLRAAFEAASGTGLATFFEQWVARPGAPDIRIESARAVGASGHRLEVRLRQVEPGYQVRVPLRVELGDGRRSDIAVDLHGPTAHVVLDMPGQPRFVMLDPDAKLFRRVEPQDIAQILRTVMLDPATRVVLGGDAESRRAGLEVAAAVLEQQPRVATAEALDGRSPLLLVVLTEERADVLRRYGLPPVPDLLSPVRTPYAYASRSKTGRPFVVVTAEDAASLRTVIRSLPHLGGQSYAVFRNGRSIMRGVWAAPARRFAVEE